MGGYGSGRQWHLGAKETTTDYRELDVNYLNKNKCLRAGVSSTLAWSRRGKCTGSIGINSDSNHITLNYRHQRTGQDWETIEYPVGLAWTECHFGGQRPWFICPAKGCGRRVGKLYGGRVFACRHCYRLAYPCQREAEDDRAINRADKIRDRLGWMPGILNFKGCKPKGMHWSTFERLEAEHDAFVAKAFAGIASRLDLLDYSINSS